MDNRYHAGELEVFRHNRDPKTDFHLLKKLLKAPVFLLFSTQEMSPPRACVTRLTCSVPNSIDWFDAKYYPLALSRYPVVSILCTAHFRRCHSVMLSKSAVIRLETKW